MCKLRGAGGWKPNLSELTTKPLRQLCSEQAEQNMTKLFECVEQNTFNLSETIDSVLMYTDTNTAVQLNDIEWRSTLTYTHPGLCHTMLINKLVSTAPIVVRLRTSPGHRHSLMLHDPRFKFFLPVSIRPQELRSTVLQLILNLTQLDSQPMKTFIFRLSLMQMDSQMLPNLWTSLDHGHGGQLSPC